MKFYLKFKFANNAKLFRIHVVADEEVDIMGDDLRMFRLLKDWQMFFNL